MSPKKNGLITLLIIVAISTSLTTFPEVSNYEALDESVKATDGYYFDKNLNIGTGISLLWNYEIRDQTLTSCFGGLLIVCKFLVEINLTESIKGAFLTDVLDDLTTYATVSVYRATSNNEKGSFSTTNHKGRVLNDALRSSFFNALVIPTFYKDDGVLYNLYSGRKPFDIDFFEMAGGKFARWILLCF